MSGFCSFCGEKRIDHARFCTSCGRDLTNVPVPCPTCGQLWTPPLGDNGLGHVPDLAINLSTPLLPPSELPRGPVMAPDYEPGIDCGNCGEPLGGGSLCARCQSKNTGVEFDPRLSS